MQAVLQSYHVELFSSCVKSIVVSMPLGQHDTTLLYKDNHEPGPFTCVSGCVVSGRPIWPPIVTLTTRFGWYYYDLP